MRVANSLATFRVAARPAAAFGCAIAMIAMIATVALPVAASAAPAGARPSIRSVSPVGKAGSVSSAPGSVTLAGWTADPDAPHAALKVAGVVDGRLRTAWHPAGDTAPVPTRYRGGAGHGFTLVVPVDDAPHTVCVVARNVGPGLNTLLRCVATPLGTRLTDAQRAAHSPIGQLRHVYTHRRSAHVVGWAVDPDFYAGRRVAVVYVDGHSAATVVTGRYRAPRPAGATSRSLFDVFVPLSSGAHVVCVWVVNAGLGDNSWLGCRTIDTRGRPAGGTVRVPNVNKKVLAEAERHLGQKYVWGAEGPKKFDCSGLVQYSYRKAGFTTPRVSEDQYFRAHLISAARAVPGDLVFYHDTEGDVYHVGIVSGPGMSVAAADPKLGVIWQQIWPDDPSVSYGSFTHR